MFMPPIFGFGQIFWKTANGSGSTSIFKNSASSATVWSGGTSTQFTNGTNCRCFTYDRKNDIIYLDYNSTEIRSLTNSTGSAATTVLSMSSLNFTGHIAGAAVGPFAIDCDPTNSRLFFIVQDSEFTTNGGAGYVLYRVNYDGSGAAEVKVLGDLSWDLENIDVRYDATTDRIYYIKALKGASGLPQIRYISPGGTGDTLVYTAAPASSGGGPYSQITNLVIDAANQHLFWTEYTNFPGDARLIFRSDMDGTNLTALASSASHSGISSATTLAFSQSLGKLYANTPSLSDADASRMNDDGSSFTDLGIPTDWPTTSVKFFLGDGFETIGSGAIL
jgi:hypothetical protein